MLRVDIEPRQNWQQTVEALGLIWHTVNGVPYWNESAYYSFNSHQIAMIENASNECYQMFVQAGQYVIDNKLLHKFSIPEEFHKKIETMWEMEPPALNYGRFDFAFDGVNPPKLLEFNCDTPTSLLEGSVVQWAWKEEVFPDKDQFNGIHEAFVAKWRDIRNNLPSGVPIHFTMAEEYSGEDEVTTAYMTDMATEAGFDDIVYLNLQDIGWDGSNFLDLDERRIDTIYKLYPWECLVHKEYGRNIIESTTQWIEPIWKMIWSNKAILPILSDLFPNHPNILKSSFDIIGGDVVDYVRKPLLSREGANVKIYQNNQCVAESGGEYGEEGYIYQELAIVPSFNGNYPIIGSWVVDGEACGMGIREGGVITDNIARFVPHIIMD